MAIHQFGYFTGQVSPDTFSSVLASYRTEVEQEHSPIQQYNPEINDLKTVRLVADELVNVSGADVMVWIRTDNADIDRVWDEDPDPSYWPPYHLKGYFKPAPTETELKSWGPDLAPTTKVVFSHRKIYELFGERMLRVGDVVKLPYNAAGDENPTYYRIENPSPTGNFRFHWLYYSCDVVALTADATVRPEGDIQSNPHQESGEVYYEGI